MALELLQRGQQRPRLAVDQPEMAAASAHLGLKADPCVGDAVGARRLLGRVPAARLGVRQGVGEHVSDAVSPLHGPDVPRERNEVAPVALGGEQVGRGGGVTRLQSGVEALEPMLHLGCSGRTDGRGHHSSPRYRWRPALNTTPEPAVVSAVSLASEAEVTSVSDAAGASSHAGGSTVSSSSGSAGASSVSTGGHRSGLGGRSLGPGGPRPWPGSPAGPRASPAVAVRGWAGGLVSARHAPGSSSVAAQVSAGAPAAGLARGSRGRRGRPRRGGRERRVGSRRAGLAAPCLLGVRVGRRAGRRRRARVASPWRRVGHLSWRAGSLGCGWHRCGAAAAAAVAVWARLAARSCRAAPPRLRHSAAEVAGAAGRRRARAGRSPPPGGRRRRRRSLGAPSLVAQSFAERGTPRRAGLHLASRTGPDRSSSARRWWPPQGSRSGVLADARPPPRRLVSLIVSVRSSRAGRGRCSVSASGGRAASPSPSRWPAAGIRPALRRGHGSPARQRGTVGHAGGAPPAQHIGWHAALGRHRPRRPGWWRHAPRQGAARSGPADHCPQLAAVLESATCGSSAPLRVTSALVGSPAPAHPPHGPTACPSSQPPP